MRKVKTITIQDHILVIIATTEAESEVTCLTTEDNQRVLPAPLTSFNLEGRVKTFRRDGEGNWGLLRTVVTPSIMFRLEEIESGAVAETDTTLLMSIFPKDEAYLAKWEASFLNQDQRESSLAADRDSVVEITEFSGDRKMSANTFSEITETISDEVIFE
jgi:hypothetical protein